MSEIAVTPPGFWRGFWLVSTLEMKQRLRSRALLVLAIVWFAIIGIVTFVAWASLNLMFSTYDGGGAEGFPLFSLIVYFVLLFGTLVAPAISAGSIGAERSQATLATTQVTLVGTWSILLGKAFAAWITGIAFLVVAAPFVIFSLVISKAGVVQLLVALLALALQIGVFTLIGVGLSALVQSQVFAIVLAYLVVAMLSIGTLIAFGLAAGATTSYVEVENRNLTNAYYAETEKCGGNEECWEAVPLQCESYVSDYPVTPTHRIWWILALNPYVVVADMVPPEFDRHRTPIDMFGGIAYLVRSLQHAPEDPEPWDDCAPPGQQYQEPDSTETLYEDSMPVWWIGFGLQIALVGLSLWGGYRRLKTPMKHLPRGSRIA